MTSSEFNDIMQGEGFRRFAAMLRVINRPEWHTHHPESKAGFYLNNFIRLAKSSHPDLRGDMLEAFTGMVTSAVEAEAGLSAYYTTETLEWFLTTLDGEQTRLILMMVLAFGSADGAMLTATDAAERTEMSESHWRNQCAAGAIPGAKKQGKTWLIPESWIEFS